MNDTIAAISTAQGIGAISIVRVSGTDAISIVSSVFSNKNFLKALSHTIHYGYIIDSDEKIDEVLVTLMRGPKTFTKEDVVEINCHGGIVTTTKILELLLTKGCRLAEPGEFTKRAFLNGRIDLTEAEGIIDLINAKSDKSRKMALNQVSGRTSEMIKSLREELALVLANIEVNLNYPEYEDIEEITVDKIEKNMDNIENKINKILSESKNGKVIKEGIKTAIVGKPNVGKSSLLNNLIGEDKAIVTNIKGTTRDNVEASIVINNIILNLIDTAGIRDTDDIVENIGVDKSLSLIDSADLVLFVLDYSEKISDEDRLILDKLKNKNYIAIINKCDLDKKIDDELIENKIYVSALKNINIEQIGDKIKEMFNLEKIETSDLTYLTSARAISILKKVKKSIFDVRQGLKEGITLDMIDIDLKNIWNLLGEVIGENYDEELIDTLFDRFCVGK